MRYEFGTPFSLTMRLLKEKAGFLMGVGGGLFLLGPVIAMIPVLIVAAAVGVAMSGLSGENMGMNGAMIAVFVVAYVLIFVPYIVGFAMITEGATRHTRGETATFGSLLGSGFARVVPLLVVTIIYLLLVSFASLFLVIPGIFLGIALSPALCVLAAEPKRGIFGALGRAWELTEGNRWLLFAQHLVISVASYVILFAAMLLFAIPMAAFSDGSQVVGPVLLSVVFALALPAYMVVASVLAAASYIGLREAKEGGAPARAASVF